MQQICRRFIASMSSLIYLLKNQFFYSIVLCYYLLLIGFLRIFWRFVKQNLLKIVVARSSVYFILLKQISYNHFYITNFNNNLCSVNVSVSLNSNVNSTSINIFDKNFNFSFYSSNRLPYEVKKYQKINLLAPKGNSNSGNMNMLPFLYISLLFF